jgi:hypothetical protein
MNHGEEDPGFVLPTNGPALFARHPKVVERFIRGFLYRHHREISIDAFQDLVMDAWVHLFSKPSHGRSLNQPSVCRGIDRVAMFDPSRAGGATAKQFFAYIKKILYNWYCCTLCGSDAYDHITVPIALNDEEGSGIEENRIGRQDSATRFEFSIIQRVRLIEFLDYLQRRDRTTFEFVCAFYQTGSYPEAARSLGIEPDKAIKRMRLYAGTFRMSKVSMRGGPISNRPPALCMDNRKLKS